nr:unnamed protein product [Naegleria fowleri]
MKRLELQISQPSYCTLSPTLLKHLSQFLVNHSETSALTHILIKNLDAENSDPLMDMLNDLYKHYEQNRPSSQILHLGFQFRKKPSQQALDSITHQCRHFIKVHMMSHDAIDTDPFIPFDIDYSNSQQMDQVVSKRNEFKQLIACSKITCLACGMVLNRNDYEEHCQRFHYSQDLMYDHSLKRRMDFSNYEIQCPSCHADVRRCDFDEHVENVCSRNRVKLCTEPRKTFQQIISEYQSIPSNTEQHDNHL